MKRSLMTTTAMMVLCAALSPTAARAGNSGVEAALASYGDVSMFYAALRNTGVLNELDPNRRYTIFAPTNQVFAQIQPSRYPCFYSSACRATLAGMLRDHIVPYKESMKELTREGEVPTIGRYRVYVQSPYVGSYTVANNTVLSGAEISGNMIYRVDGVIVTENELAQFRRSPPLADAVTEERTVTTYRTPAAYLTPGSGYPPAATSETVTEKTYAVPAEPSDAGSYPNGTTYPRDTSTTAVTRTITTRP
jgi:uncharacterized surface protein with fasciclin (FAS1) repeats